MEGTHRTVCTENVLVAGGKNSLCFTPGWCTQLSSWSSIHSTLHTAKDTLLLMSGSVLRSCGSSSLRSSWISWAMVSTWCSLWQDKGHFSLHSPALTLHCQLMLRQELLTGATFIPKPHLIPPSAWLLPSQHSLCHQLLSRRSPRAHAVPEVSPNPLAGWIMAGTAPVLLPAGVQQVLIAPASPHLPSEAQTPHS